MLFHNIKNSEQERVIKQILEVQENETRMTTWYASTNKAVEKYGITKKVDEVLKSAWKKEVKEKIQEIVENEIKQKCKEMKKTRSVKDGPYCMKEYMKETPLKEASDILRTRLHMSKFTCNYGGERNICPLCGRIGEVTTEHYFGECHATRKLAEIWKTGPGDLEDTMERVRRAKNHLKKVEVMMERHMKLTTKERKSSEKPNKVAPKKKTIIKKTKIKKS